MSRLPLRALVGALMLALLPAAARAQIAVVGNSIQEREAPVGGSYEGTIRVSNTGTESREARIYQTDYLFHADGRTLYEAPGSQPRSNAGWVAVSPSRVVIPAGQTIDVRYAVKVPVGDSLRGSYWSVVMVEGLAPSEGPGATGRRSVDLQATVRYGVQVVTHIGATGAPTVGFAGAGASKVADGTGAMVVDLTNTGDRAARLKLMLEVYAQDGRQVATLQQARGLVYPGSSVRQRFALGALPAGTYKAVLVADAGGDAVFGAQYTLRF
jgi:hypothetical protein